MTPSGIEPATFRFVAQHHNHCANMEKYCTAWKVVDDNWAHAHCILDNEGCKHTLRICNTFSFSTLTIVERTRLIVTLYVDYIACLVRHSQCCSSSLRYSGTWRHNKTTSGRNVWNQSPSDAAPRKDRDLFVFPVCNLAPGYEAIMGWRCISRLS